MPSNVFSIKNPTQADIYLLESQKKERGTLGRFVVTISSDNVMTAEGIILVTESLSFKMIDMVNRSPQGMFNLTCKTKEEDLVIKRCSGSRVEEFFLGGVKMANVHFKQKCLKETEFTVSENNLKDKEFITCRTDPPESPRLGDIYYNKKTKLLRMFTSYGWSDTDLQLPSPPKITETAGRTLLLPANVIVFMCQPLEINGWTRNIDLRRARKVLQIKNRKTDS